MHKDERVKIATALGYYARATDPEVASLSAAVKAHALAAYRNDIDCQIAFRKGWQQAEEHIEANGPEAKELKTLTHVIREMAAEFITMRNQTRALRDEVESMRYELRIMNDTAFNIAAKQRIEAAHPDLNINFNQRGEQFPWHAPDATKRDSVSPTCPCPLCNPPSKVRESYTAIESDIKVNDVGELFIEKHDSPRYFNKP